MGKKKDRIILRIFDKCATYGNIYVSYFWNQKYKIHTFENVSHKIMTIVFMLIIIFDKYRNDH